MCMCHASYKPLKTQYGWKVLEYCRLGYGVGGCWTTPIQGTKVVNNKLIAKGRVSKDGFIDSGVIHCFRSEKLAREHWLLGLSDSNCPRAVFKVKGTNQVAHNTEEIAFKKVEFIDTVNDWEI